MKKLVTLLVACAAPAWAQLTLTGAGGTSKAPVTYSGPGDVVSGATAWYGLRAYNAAYATGSNKGINIRCASGGSIGTTFDILITSSGNLDTATASSDCGTDGVVTGTISGTLLTVSAVTSGAVSLGDQITGASVTNPSYIVSNGTGSGGIGTYNLNVSSTVSVGESITAAAAMAVTKAYDQSGNSRDASQATTTAQPLLLLNCIGSLPCLHFKNAASQILTWSGTSSPVAQPYTASWVAKRDGASGNNVSVFGSNGNTSQTGFSSTANNVFIYAGVSVPTASASDASFHSIQSIFNFSTSILYVDGTSNSVSTSTNSYDTGKISIGGSNDLSGNFLDAYWNETGVWSSQFSSGNESAMCHNQRLYWGTPGSC